MLYDFPGRAHQNRFRINPHSLCANDANGECQKWLVLNKLIENDRLIGMLYSVKETTAKKGERNNCQKRGINDETMKRHLVPQRDAHGKPCLTLAHFSITVSLTFTLWFEWVVITTGPMET